MKIKTYCYVVNLPLDTTFEVLSEPESIIRHFLPDIEKFDKRDGKYYFETKKGLNQASGEIVINSDGKNDNLQYLIDIIFENMSNTKAIIRIDVDLLVVSAANTRVTMNGTYKISGRMSLISNVGAKFIIKKKLDKIIEEFKKYLGNQIG